jgi:hypothetical protein
MDDLQQTLDKFGVPQPEQNEIKAIVESTHEAIVVAPLQEGPSTRAAEDSYRLERPWPVLGETPKTRNALGESSRPGWSHPGSKNGSDRSARPGLIIQSRPPYRVSG